VCGTEGAGNVVAVVVGFARLESGLGRRARACSNQDQALLYKAAVAAIKMTDHTTTHKSIFACVVVVWNALYSIEEVIKVWWMF
jgi:hypothetical protein